jgi:hypothetical protein
VKERSEGEKSRREVKEGQDLLDDKADDGDSGGKICDDMVWVLTN